jgi:hypothetical protein
MKLLKAIAFGLSGLALAASAHAAAITPGNLVIYRVDGGGSALGANATAVFLDEYTTTGTLVQSIPLATTGTGALTATGNSSTEGIISPSQDGTKLVFTGYRVNVGTASPTNTAIPKVIGTVDLAGVPDLSTAFTDGGTNAVRSATTVNGSNYYVATAGAVRYVATPSGAATSTVIDARNSRQVNLFGNVLWASNGSTAITGKVQTYGTLPTSTTTATPVVSLLTTDAVNGFVALDLDAGVAGVDTLYVLSTVETLLRKYTFNGTSWTATGSVASTAADLTAVANGTNVDLYLTTGAALQSLTDASGFGGTLTATPTSIATAGANTAFRGIGVLVPEPSSLALFGGAALILTARRRQGRR